MMDVMNMKDNIYNEKVKLAEMDKVIAVRILQDQHNKDYEEASKKEQIERVETIHTRFGAEQKQMFLLIDKHEFDVLKLRRDLVVHRIAYYNACLDEMENKTTPTPTYINVVAGSGGKTTQRGRGRPRKSDTN